MVYERFSGGAVRRWVLGLAVLCLALWPSAAFANQSAIDMRVEMSSDLRVTVAGNLSDARGESIAGEKVYAAVADQVVFTVRTGGGGDFAMEFDVPGKLRSGNRQLTVSFDGNGQYAPARSSVTLALGGEARGTLEAQRPAADSAELAAPPALDVPTLIGTAKDTTPVNGAVVELKGTLAHGDGEPVPAAGIEVFDARGEATDSFTVTDGDGAFQTFYEVPVEHEGAWGVTLRYQGDRGIAPAQATVTLDVRYVEAAAEEPTPAEEPSVVEEIVESEEAAEELVETSEPVPATPAAVDAASGVSGWLIGAVAAVGAAAVLIGGVLGMAVFRRKDADGSEDFALFDSLD